MKTINTNELKSLQQGGDRTALINVLSEDAFRQEHIPGSENVPLNAPDFIERVERIAGGRDQPVIVYCASRQCDASPTAARRLEEAGFTDVTDYEAGIADWKEAGERIEGSAVGAPG